MPSDNRFEELSKSSPHLPYRENRRIFTHQTGSTTPASNAAGSTPECSTAVLEDSYP